MASTPTPSLAFVGGSGLTNLLVCQSSDSNLVLRANTTGIDVGSKILVPTQARDSAVCGSNYVLNFTFLDGAGNSNNCSFTRMFMPEISGATNALVMTSTYTPFSAAPNTHATITPVGSNIFFHIMFTAIGGVTGLTDGGIARVYATLYSASEGISTTVTLARVSTGVYEANWAPPVEGNWYVGICDENVLGERGRVGGACISSQRTDLYDGSADVLLFTEPAMDYSDLSSRYAISNLVAAIRNSGRSCYVWNYDFHPPTDTGAIAQAIARQAGKTIACYYPYGNYVTPPDTLFAANTVAMENFITQGGKLLMVHHAAPSDFSAQYLGWNYTASSVIIGQSSGDCFSNVVGVAGDPISDGLNLTLPVIYSPYVSAWTARYTSGEYPNNSHGIPCFLFGTNLHSTSTPQPVVAGVRTRNAVTLAWDIGQPWMDPTLRNQIITRSLDQLDMTTTGAVPVALAITPTSALVPPTTSKPFSAALVDEFGYTLTNPVTFTWRVSGGGTIDTNGLFTSGSVTGGPYTVTAAAGGLTNTASVTVMNVFTGALYQLKDATPAWVNFNITNSASEMDLWDGTTHSTLAGNGYVWTIPAGGLNIGARTISNTNDVSGFTLEMNDGVLSGTGTLTTARAAQTGNITINGATDITLGSINTGQGGSQLPTGNITINHQGSLSIGAVSASNSYVWGSPGAITFHGDSGPLAIATGAFMSGNLNASSGRGRSGGNQISIQGYTNVVINGYVYGHVANYDSDATSLLIGAPASPVGPVTIRGLIDLRTGPYNSGYAAAGSLGIYSTGDVLLRATNGVAQDFKASTSRYGGKDSCNVTLLHDGQLLFNDLSVTKSPTLANYWQPAAQAITLHGDALANGANGALGGRDILGACNSIGVAPAFSVDIAGYTNVTLRTVDTHGDSKTNSGGTGQNAGNIVMTNITGAITISSNLLANNTWANAAGAPGTITLVADKALTIGGTISTASGRGAPYHGAVTLQSCHSNILLAALDLGQVGVTKIDANTGAAITNVFLGLAVGSSGGSGTLDDPLITTQMLLRLPYGQTLTYNVDVATNSYLNGCYYRLATLAGAPGLGGLLVPVTALPPTSPAITTQPASTSVTAGATATFTVGAGGSIPLRYQWLTNATPIAGATSASYTTPATTTNDSGLQFSVIISNAYGVATSSVAVLTVVPPSTPPTVTTPAAAATNPVTGTSVGLSVLGADDNGEANLAYTWSTTGTPPATVTFTPNVNNAAKNTTATFSKIGNYGFQVVIRDANNLTATSSVSVTVNATLSALTLAPAGASVVTNATQGFTATGTDQFGAAMGSVTATTWSVSGGGTITTGGLFTAAAATGGPYTVTATYGVATGTTSVSVVPASAVAMFQLKTAATAWVNCNITNATTAMDLWDGATHSTVAGAGYVWTLPSGGLNIGTQTICNTTDTNGFKLDLNGSMLSGNGILRTTRTGNNTAGPILITNVAALSVNGINSYSPAASGYASGGGAIILAGNNSGALSVGSSGLVSHCFMGTGGGGAININGFSAVTVSGALDSATDGGSGKGGLITIGATNAPINGGIVLGNVVSGNAGGGNGVTIMANGSVQAGALTLCTATNGTGGAGNLSISHKGDLTIGAIMAHAAGQVASCQAVLASDGTGSCAVNGAIDLCNYYRGVAGYPGTLSPSLNISNYVNVTIAGAITTHWGDTAASKNAGNIVITNVSGAVTLGDVDASNAKAGQYGGNLTIITTNGSITLGTPNLNGNAAAAGTAYDGSLTLTAGGSAGIITLAGLDLSMVSTASLNAACGAAITNALLNFATNGTGSGANGDPVVTTQSVLRLPAGQVLAYNPNVTSNSYLAGKYYKLASLTGVAGQGGVLSPAAPDLGADAYGISNSWKMQYFGSTNGVGTGALEDWDHDGMNNYGEWLAGTDPANADSNLSILHSEYQGSTNLVMRWSSVAGKIYRIESFTNLFSSGTNILLSNIAATPPVNTATAVVGQAAVRFFRVAVYEKPDPLFVSLDATQALALVQSRSTDPTFTVLDVRTAAEYATQHITGAINIDYYAADFAAQLNALDKNQAYLVHCRTGVRGGATFTMMQGMGFHEVYHLTGGINAFIATPGSEAFLTP